MEAYDNVAIYENKMKEFHDKKILKREFKASQMVLLYNSRPSLFPSKLKLIWLRPFKIVRLSPNGLVELQDKKLEDTFMVNG